MQITSFYNTNTNVSVRVEPASTNNETPANTTSAIQPNGAAVNDMPFHQQTNADETMTMRYVINELLQQFSEWIRVSSESRRMEFLYSILLKESRRNSDLFGKIMDIARRFMRNEDVLPEEMRFLAENNPQLLYVVTILKEEASDADSNERRRAKDRRGKDRRSLFRRRDHINNRSKTSDSHGIKVIERKSPAIPRELVKQINSLLVDKSIKKSYDAVRKKKNHLSISVNTVITNPHDSAD